MDMSQAAIVQEVLTIEEVAQYLRLPREMVERQASQGQIPGRQVEGHWRFSKAAIEAWLQQRDNRAVLLGQAGALAGDKTLGELRRAIYAERGRPEVEERAGL
jgi:excisionase family DNA binding protein